MPYIFFTLFTDFSSFFFYSVGRTARTGKQGTTVTILRSEEVHHFKAILQKAEHRKCREMKVDWTNDLGKYMDRYRTALTELKVLLRGKGEREREAERKQKEGDEKKNFEADEVSQQDTMKIPVHKKQGGDYRKELVAKGAYKDEDETEGGERVVEV